MELSLPRSFDVADLYRGPIGESTDANAADAPLAQQLAEGGELHRDPRADAQDRPVEQQDVVEELEPDLATARRQQRVDALGERLERAEEGLVVRAVPSEQLS